MKLAVIFPGIGYHNDKPLLYYGKKAAKNLGYEILEVNYGNFPPDVKGSQEKMREAFYSALMQAEKILADVDFGKYESLLFISKSVGTVVASAYSQMNGIAARNIFYTPVEATFSYGKHDGIVFHGTNDGWVETDTVKKKCAGLELPLYITEGANHSLETGDIVKDIENLREIMDISVKYMNEAG